ncbi:MAG: hypothetical protein ACLUVA_01750 [Faecalibacterium sp.]
MMKKAIKKLLAALLAVAMVCAMAIPAFAYNPGRLRRTSTQTTSYDAFQIFKGDVKVMTLMTLRFPTLSGAKASLIITIFWPN